MPVSFDNSVACLVRSDYRVADVFDRQHVDYCRHGGATLKTVCDLHNLDPYEFRKELEEATRDFRIPTLIQFQKWKTDFLIDYILNIHHDYLQVALPSLEIQLTTLMQTHPDRYPELAAIQKLFSGLSSLVTVHNRHEEEVIFPYVKQIDTAYRKREPYGNLFVRTLRKPLSNMEKEHESIFTYLDNLESSTNNYTLPDGVCLRYEVLYKKLREITDGLKEQLNLENVILFPRAIQIENELLRV